MLGLIRTSFAQSDSTYGSPRVSDDLAKWEERCSRKRVARLMRSSGLRARARRLRPPADSGIRPEHRIAPNRLYRQFGAAAPNQKWVADFTHIRTHEGWLYLAVVIDLFSWQVIGWSMQPRMDRELALNALLTALWRRLLGQAVTVHSDQGSQLSSYDWQNFLKAHNLQPSMSRCGNFHDNAVAESFFQVLKRERIRRRVYADREAACRDIFDYIEMFYNPKRRHGYNNPLSPVDYEQRYFQRLECV